MLKHSYSYTLVGCRNIPRGWMERAATLDKCHLEGIVRGPPASRQIGTVKTYHNGFARWKHWTRQFSEVPSLPAKSIHVAL